MKCTECNVEFESGDEVVGTVIGIATPTIGGDIEVDVTEPIIYRHSSC